MLVQICFPAEKIEDHNMINLFLDKFVVKETTSTLYNDYNVSIIYYE